MAFADRGRYADEFIEVLELLWAPGQSSFGGAFFCFDGTAGRAGLVGLVG